MKITGFQKTGITLAAATLVAFLTPKIFAQDTNAFGQYEMPTGTPANSQPPPPETQAAPPEMPNTGSTTPLSGPDEQILQLSQAKISDSTIITYIQNSSTIYGLDASQIVYLKQNGVSEAVINAMLNQRTAMGQQQQQAQMPPPGSDQSAGAYQGAVAQPSSPAPSTTYVVPDSQTANYNSWASQYYYYPYYSYYPYYGYPYYSYGWYWPYWGWGGYRGWGYYGGYHGYYGGFHGGFHGSVGGGGFHGGGGGGFHGR
ncbi:MAG TPA: hypothetical protein VMF08_19290 [Candidatus Sulfotelmatobacter sp.]|nr:hypothetical protein [Candidatus Sulfotelmatobacter sp.]